MGNGNNISMTEIAKKAGTSVATVSRVINQNGRFSRETEERVRKIIEEYSYQPNRLARSLRMQRTQVVGILVPDISNEFFSGITREVQDNLFRKGYMTFICNTNENVVQEQRQVSMLIEQQVDGIVYIGGNGGAAMINIPVVYIDRDPYSDSDKQKGDYVIIESDNLAGGYLAGKRLLERDVKRPAVVYFGGNLSTIKGRLAGFRKAMREKKIRLDESLLIEVEGNSWDEGRRAARILLNEHSGVDSVFFTSDALAVGGINYLQKNGVRVPEDMAVIGFDDIAAGDMITPGLTTIRQDMKAMGKLAAGRILDMINQAEHRKKHIRVPVSLVERESV